MSAVPLSIMVAVAGGPSQALPAPYWLFTILHNQHVNDVRRSGTFEFVPAGTGIGLYLANRIMTLHGGTILIKGRGPASTFTLVFPASRLV